MGGLRRAIGLLLSIALFGALLVLGLRSGWGLAPPDADLRNGQVFIQDNLWSAGSHQYAVWVGPNGTPYVGSRPRGGGKWKVVDLGALRGNPLAAPTADDEHNVYAIGVDAQGGVHVAGNMKAGRLRYVRGTPGLNRWSTRPGPRPGPSVSYPAFTALPGGRLLFWRQEGSVVDHGSIVLDVLPAGRRSWRSRGAVLDGTASGETPYLNHIAVDPRTGTVHLMFVWRGDADVATTNDIGYARSSDAGRTWTTSDGTPLDVPITHAGAETVFDTPPTGSGLINQGGLTVDAAGRPHGVVVFNRAGGGRAWLHVWLDRGSWRREWLTDLDLDGRPQLAGTPDGRVWLLGVRGSAVEAIDVTPGREHAPSQELARVPVGWEVNYDSQALARDGVVRMLIPDGDTPHVVEASLTDG